MPGGVQEDEGRRAPLPQGMDRTGDTNKGNQTSFVLLHTQEPFFFVSGIKDLNEK